MHNYMIIYLPTKPSNRVPLNLNHFELRFLNFRQFDQTNQCKLLVNYEQNKIDSIHDELYQISTVCLKKERMIH